MLVIYSNLKSLGINFKFYSEVGTDMNGKKIVQKNKKNNYKILKIKISTLKKIFINDKQIFRQDEEAVTFNKNVSEELYKNIKKKDLVIISDYNKGCINKSIGNKLKKIVCFVVKKQTISYKHLFSQT